MSEAVAQSCSLKKTFLRNFAKFTGKHLCQTLFFHKVGGLSPPTLLKNRLWHRCFPVNLSKFLRTPFFIEHLRWLLLQCSPFLQSYLKFWTTWCRVLKLLIFNCRKQIFSKIEGLIIRCVNLFFISNWFFQYIKKINI